jgi:hypothetical protein
VTASVPLFRWSASRSAAFSELLVEPMIGYGIYEVYRQQAEAAEQRRQPQPVQSVPQPGSMEWSEAQKKKG